MNRKMEPKAPEHLREATRQWWESVVSEYDLEQHHRRLLSLAAEAWDRCTEAREALAEHGLVFEDRFDQPRARPEVAIERDSRTAFCRTLRELGLDVDEPAEGSRPAAIRGNANLKIARG
ncbi:MAG: P27 family phage terminase small subunit [Candidatus Nealsonbacteria bacterium]|nr:P27 family phage terminase small subunit [Candidatus Nealsonbacteria bacterium]